MRTSLLVLALVLAGAATARAEEEAGLPPPQVVRRSVSPPRPAPRPPAPAPAPIPPPPRPPGVVAAPSPAPTTRIPPPPRPPGVAAIPVTPPAPLPPPPAHEPVDVRTFAGPGVLGGAAGYDRGFLVRGTGFSLRVNLLLQARYERFDWNDVAPAPGGDRSGFSLPRASLRFSGDAPCSTRYLLELDVGSEGGPLAWDDLGGCVDCAADNLGPRAQTRSYDVLREAWIEFAPSQALRVRAGLLRTPATRQLMVRPARQQFVDIALASAWTGLGMPGYTDRNRDFGVMLHGALGAREQLGWMLTVTNGDGGDGVRNVLDGRSSDNLAFAGRLNWAFLEPVGYQEGALAQYTNRSYGELGLWAYYYADRVDRPHTTKGDYLRVGVDLALGHGPWSLTGALTWAEDRDVDGVSDDTSTAWLLQLGHHFVGSAWEIAARWSGYDTEGDLTGDGRVQEFAAGLNYYLNGHGNKLQIDAAYVDTDSGGALILDPYPAYPGFLGGGDAGWLLRLQWQLAL